MWEFLRSPGNFEDGLCAKLAVLITHQRSARKKLEIFLKVFEFESFLTIKSYEENVHFPTKFLATCFAASFTSLYLMTSHWTRRTFGPQCLNKSFVSSSSSLTPAKTVNPFDDSLRVSWYPSPVSEPVWRRQMTWLISTHFHRENLTNFPDMQLTLIR